MNVEHRKGILLTFFLYEALKGAPPKRSEVVSIIEGPFLRHNQSTAGARPPRALVDMHLERLEQRGYLQRYCRHEAKPATRGLQLWLSDRGATVAHVHGTFLERYYATWERKEHVYGKFIRQAKGRRGELRDTLWARLGPLWEQWKENKQHLEKYFRKTPQMRADEEKLAAMLTDAILGGPYDMGEEDLENVQSGS